MKELVMILGMQYRERLGAIRTVPGWKAAADDQQIWLRGPVDNGGAQVALNSLPATATYFADDKGRLFPIGKQTPVLTIKELAWQKLTDFLPVSLPVSAMPGTVPATIPVRLSRTGTPQPVKALLTTFSIWKTYVKTAPMIRLQQLRMAVSESQQVIVMGAPLPAIKGETYWEYKNLLVPSGYHFDPPVLADLITSTENILLFYPEGKCIAIPLTAFNQAKRHLIA